MRTMDIKDLTFIIFGGTGDLVRRKLVPALAGLVKEGVLSKNSIIIGIGRREFDNVSYKQFLIDSTSKNEEKRYLTELDIRYLCNDHLQPDYLPKLIHLLDNLDPLGTRGRIYYLAATNRLYNTQRITSNTYHL